MNAGASSETSSSATTQETDILATTTTGPARSLKFQYVSDIHLEHYKIHKAEHLLASRWIKPDPTADALVLAGDIGYPERASYGLFLRWCSENWPAVFVVAGNHEFYNEREQPPHSRHEKLEILRMIARSLPNVWFLDREVVEFRPGVWVAGCTLWSFVPEDMGKYAKEGMNDFRSIMSSDMGDPLTVADYNAWHKRDFEWLKSVLQDCSKRGDTMVVITHHLPTPKLIHLRYADYPLNCCFATDLEQDLIQPYKPVAWFCGHSHTGATIRIGKTQLALNPHGYLGERVDTRDPGAVLEVLY